MWVQHRTSTCFHPAGVGVLLLEGAAFLHRVESTGAVRKEVVKLRHFLHNRCGPEWECSQARVSEFGVCNLAALGRTPPRGHFCLLQSIMVVT